jgi:hypothetical protein
MAGVYGSGPVRARLCKKPAGIENGVRGYGDVLSPEMKSMARQIIAAQKKEIAQFDQWLARQK